MSLRGSAGVIAGRDAFYECLSDVGVIRHEAERDIDCGDAALSRNRYFCIKGGTRLVRSPPSARTDNHKQANTLSIERLWGTTLSHRAVQHNTFKYHFYMNKILHFHSTLHWKLNSSPRTC